MIKYNYYKISNSKKIRCLIKHQKKKTKIEDLFLNSVWENNNLKKKDYKNLHSFFWLFNLTFKNLCEKIN